jgi:hypothetical protein
MKARKITIKLEISVGPVLSRAEYNQSLSDLRRITGISDVQVKYDHAQGYLFLIDLDLDKFDKPSMLKIHDIFSEEEKEQDTEEFPRPIIEEFLEE